MDLVLLALLSGAALCAGDLYTANKFRYFYPKLTTDLLPRGAPRWKRVWVYRNQSLKYVGLFGVWLGALGARFSADSGAETGQAFYVVASLGLVLYLAARLWPVLVKNGPLGRSG